jgi:hypothetical protein
MTGDLATVIDAARVDAFVGRSTEVAVFRSALSGHTALRVLLVHGPGGIGKTTLLDQFRIRARHDGRTVVALDARDIDCSPEGFRGAFDAARDQDRTADRFVLLVDGYDRLIALDDWIRQAFIPSLPSDCVVVLVSRDPPAAPWRTDPGWRALAGVCRLGPLDEAESIDLLTRFAVPPNLHPRLTALGRGHPLTLALLADTAVTGGVPDSLADAPDLVAALASQVVGEAPDEAHALGYALCALAWITTEDLLRNAVGDRAPQVWTWLEHRPFITRGIDGLYPHDLVRDVLEADLRRRSPDTYRRVRRIIHLQAIAALRGSDPGQRQLWAHQKLYLHRRSPLSGSFWALRDRGSAAVLPGRPGDHPDVLDLVERFDGPANARLAARWLEAQPENLSVVRSPAGIAGFLLQVVYPTDPALIDDDPIARTAIDVATRISPARPGEQISIGRFNAGQVDYQRDAYAVLTGCIGSTIMWLTRPLAWSFVASADPEFWGPCFEYLELNTRVCTSFDGREYTLFGIDWRRLPIDDWLELMSEREVTGAAGPIPADLLRPAPLPRAQFDDAIRAALRELTSPERLRGNPLTRSRLVSGRTGDPAARLRQAVLAGIARTGGQPRTATLPRVLDRTFVHPAKSGGPPPQCSICRSRPTDGTWPRRSTPSPTCCGRWRSVTSGCRWMPDRAGHGLSTG